MAEPDLQSLLLSLDGRLTRIEAALARLESPPAASSEAPEADAAEAVAALLSTLDAGRARLWGGAAMVTDIADETLANLARRGIDVDARAQATLSLLERLSAPEIQPSLLALVEAAPHLAALTRQAQALPGLAATAADALDDAIAQGQSAGLDPYETLEGLKVLGVAAAQLLASPELRFHLGEGVLAPTTVRAISTLGASLSQTIAEPRGTAGPLALLRALRDPDVGRALDFALSFARHLGRSLERDRLPSPA